MSTFFRCLESRIDKDNTLYGKFTISPVSLGQGNSFANSLRRSLFSDLSGLAITHFCITSKPDLNYEFSTLPGLTESLLDFSLNLKKTVLTGRVIDFASSFESVKGNEFSAKGFDFAKKECEYEYEIEDFKRDFRKDFKKEDFKEQQKTSNLSHSLAFLKKRGTSRKIDLKRQMQAKFTDFSASSPLSLKPSFLKSLILNNMNLPKATKSSLNLPEATKSKISKKISLKSKILTPLANSKKISRNSKKNVNLLSNKSPFDNPIPISIAPIGFLKAKGPAILKAKDLILPFGVRCVHPDQYLGTLAADSILSIKFLISVGRGFIVQDELLYSSLSRAKLAPSPSLNYLKPISKIWQKKNIKWKWRRNAQEISIQKPLTAHSINGKKISKQDLTQIPLVFPFLSYNPCIKRFSFKSSSLLSKCFTLALQGSKCEYEYEYEYEIKDFKKDFKKEINAFDKEKQSNIAFLKETKFLNSYLRKTFLTKDKVAPYIRGNSNAMGFEGRTPISLYTSNQIQLVISAMDIKKDVDFFMPNLSSICLLDLNLLIHNFIPSSTTSLIFNNDYRTKKVNFFRPHSIKSNSLHFLPLPRAKPLDTTFLGSKSFNGKTMQANPSNLFAPQHGIYSFLSRQLEMSPKKDKQIDKVFDRHNSIDNVDILQKAKKLQELEKNNTLTIAYKAICNKSSPFLFTALPRREEKTLLFNDNSAVDEIDDSLPFNSYSLASQEWGEKRKGLSDQQLSFLGESTSTKMQSTEVVDFLHYNNKLLKKQLMWGLEQNSYPIIPLDVSFTPVSKVNYQLSVNRDIEETQETITLEIWTNGSITPKRALQESCLSLAQDFYNLFCHVNELPTLQSWWKRESKTSRITCLPSLPTINFMQKDYIPSFSTKGELLPKTKDKDFMPLKSYESFEIFNLKASSNASDKCKNGVLLKEKRNNQTPCQRQVSDVHKVKHSQEMQMLTGDVKNENLFKIEDFKQIKDFFKIKDFSEIENFIAFGKENFKKNDFKIEDFNDIRETIALDKKSMISKNVSENKDQIIYKQLHSQLKEDIKINFSEKVNLKVKQKAQYLHSFWRLNISDLNLSLDTQLILKKLNINNVYDLHLFILKKSWFLFLNLQQQNEIIKTYCNFGFNSPF